MIGERLVRQEAVFELTDADLAAADSSAIFAWRAA